MCFGLSVLRNLLKACLMLLVVLLVCFARLNFSFFQKYVDFFDKPFPMVFFSINWSITTFCWLSGHSKITESLLNASC